MFTIQEYINLEESAVEKHEFHDGEVLAMSGGTPAHSRISSNLARALENRLTGKPCQAFDSQLRVRISATSRFVYPDASVVCGELEMDPEDPKHSVTNPKVIIEVLSDSTELYDRKEKFELYRKLMSMQEYVLVSQSQPQVEVFQRQSDDSWRYTSFSGIDSAAVFSSLGLQIPLSEIYARLSFPAAE